MGLYWKVYFWFLFCMMIIGLGIDTGRHGKEKTGKYNIWISIVSCILFIPMFILLFQVIFR